MPSEVTYEDLVSGFRAVGLRPGDIVCTHSSLSSFGHVVDGAPAVVTALLDCISPGGTLMAPTFSDYFLPDTPRIYDRENTPSRMGVISETVRTWTGAVRSDHPSHPFAAIGPAANDLFPPGQQTAWGIDSPLKRLEVLGGKILLIGADYNTVTLFHLLEAERQVSYRQWLDVTGTVILDGESTTRTIPTFNRKPGVKYEFRPFGRLLERKNIVRRTMIGTSEIRCFPVAPALAVGRPLIQNEENFLRAP